jgi:hypothetical protein
MTTPKLRALFELIDLLDADEREELRAYLDGGSCDPAEWTRAWNDELGRRLEQIERGEVELIDGEAFFADWRRSE